MVATITQEEIMTRTVLTVPGKLIVLTMTGPHRPQAAPQMAIGPVHRARGNPCVQSSKHIAVDVHLPIRKFSAVTRASMSTLRKWKNSDLYPKYVIRAFGKVPATSEQIAAGQLEGVAGYVES